MEEIQQKSENEKSDKKEELKEKITINLNKTNKLRKLKKSIGESKISSEEYELRIREHYNNMNNIKNNDLYKWAEDDEENNNTTNDNDLLNEGDDLEKLLRTNKSSNILSFSLSLLEKSIPPLPTLDLISLSLLDISLTILLSVSLYLSKVSFI